MATITTPLTKLLGIKHPIMLAGMNVAAGPDLAAAVTNAGGLGVIGGVGYTPQMLREQIADLKNGLDDKSAPVMSPNIARRPPCRLTLSSSVSICSCLKLALVQGRP